MSSGSLFSNTLQTITTTKLEELSKKRREFEDRRQALLTRISEQNDPLERLIILVDGVKACFSYKGPLSRAEALGVDIGNIQKFIAHARYDTSLASKVNDEWVDCLIQHLNVQSLRYEYADLYGKLVTEWLSVDRAAKPTVQDPDISMTGSFEDVPPARKLEARAIWERMVFEPATVDEEALRTYLSGLFGLRDPVRKDASKDLLDLRTKVTTFERSLATPNQFSADTLCWVIDTLVASDLLTNEKRSVLREFRRNPVVLAEISDVLNMRMADLSSWSWGPEVSVEQRRELRGSYSIFMHEDLLQAMFLHYIGTKWSVFFKKNLREFCIKRELWSQSDSRVPYADLWRRKYYLGLRSPDDCFGHVTAYGTERNLQAVRTITHRQNYFLFQLLDSDQDRIAVAEGEQEAQHFRGSDHDEEDGDSDADVGAVQAAKRKRAAAPMQMQMQVQQSMQAQACMRSNPYAPQAPAIVRNGGLFGQPARPPMPPRDEEHSNAYQASPTRNPMEAKQRLLHLLSAEVAVNRALHGELTCFRGSFEQWNSSLPHVTILGVMGLFGVSQKWITFFKTFLQAPLKFDDDQSDARLRRRGTPGSHALSDVFGETILFCLDFAVHQKTDGGLLHRLNDDCWFWSPSQDKVIQAWQAMDEFAKVTGTKIDHGKTSSVRIVDESKASPELDVRLPQGKIRWGFLYMDPTSGRFQIDQEMVKEHTQQLRSQLQSKSRSIFDWISAYNAYAATFFDSNFGQPANCFGRVHVNDMLETHSRIQSTVFEGGNAVEYLKREIRDRFQVENVPDGFLFFPLELGGLDLKSPFIQLMQSQESLMEKPALAFDKFLERERDTYLLAKKAFERGDHRSHHASIVDPIANDMTDLSTFMSYEEYTRYREKLPTAAGHDSLASIYISLLQKPTQSPIAGSNKMLRAVERLETMGKLRGITSDWDEMDPYWQWVTQLYGSEIVNRFAGLSIVDARLLPIGMVGLFRERRIQWHE